MFGSGSFQFELLDVYLIGMKCILGQWYLLSTCKMSVIHQYQIVIATGKVLRKINLPLMLGCLDN